MAHYEKSPPFPPQLVSTHSDVLDKEAFVCYNVSKLAILDINQKGMMITKSISSTQAQNNFGQVLDDVTHNRTRYIVERRGVPQAIILSFDDFAHVLSDESERQQMDTILRELRPEYRLGQVLSPTDGSSDDKQHPGYPK